jgi:hypothetical protein
MVHQSESKSPLFSLGFFVWHSGALIVNAVCFSCGQPKSEPMVACPSCKRKPNFREDQIASFALSLQCLKEHNLIKGSDYIKKRKQLPKFHESVRRKAAQMVESYIEVDKEDSDLDMSSAFFDIDLVADRPKTVTVHAIGKPPNVALDHHSPNSKQKTYHTLEWEVGKDVPAEEVELNQDPSGELYVWYRWFGSAWTPKFVSRQEFEQLRNVER